MSRVTDGWQAIDMAPKDGTAFIGGRQEVDGFWAVGRYYWETRFGPGAWIDDENGTPEKLTHWRVLPDFSEAA